MKGFKESTIAEFLKDVNFLPPTGENVDEFAQRYFVDRPSQIPGSPQNSSQGTTSEEFGMIQENPLVSALKGLQTAFDSDAADLSFWANYFLFTPEGAKLGPEFGGDGVNDRSAQLNVVYPKKNLEDVQSASENLANVVGSPVAPYPKHEPQLPFLVLNQSTFFEGVEYPAGTKIFYEVK